MNLFYDFLIFLGIPALYTFPLGHYSQKLFDCIKTEDKELANSFADQDSNGEPYNNYGLNFYVWISKAQFRKYETLSDDTKKLAEKLRIFHIIGYFLILACIVVSIAF